MKKRDSLVSVCVCECDICVCVSVRTCARADHTSVRATREVRKEFAHIEDPSNGLGVKGQTSEKETPTQSGARPGDGN